MYLLCMLTIFHLHCSNVELIVHLLHDKDITFTSLALNTNLRSNDECSDSIVKMYISSFHHIKQFKCKEKFKSLSNTSEQ